MKKYKSKYYKHPKFGHVYGEPIMTPVGRFCWPSLIKPKDVPQGFDGAPRYEVTLLLDQNDKKVKEFYRKVNFMVKEMLELYNHKNPAKLSGLDAAKDGDGFDLEKYPYYENRFILVARNAKAVDIYSKDEEKIMPSEIIGGAEGRILVTPIITAKGVSFKLELVQFIKDDGTRYGGANRDLSSFLTALDEDSKEEDEDEDDDDSEDDNDEDEDEDEEKEEHDDEEIPTKLAAKGKGRPKRKLDSALNKL